MGQTEAAIADFERIVELGTHPGLAQQAALELMRLRGEGECAPSASQVMAALGSGRIAFVSDRDGNPEIYVSNADGSNPVNLTRHPGEDYAPAWSPDGTRIAFFSTRDGNAEIYAINADG